MNAGVQTCSFTISKCNAGDVYCTANVGVHICSRVIDIRIAPDLFRKRYVPNSAHGRQNVVQCPDTIFKFISLRNQLKYVSHKVDCQSGVLTIILF